MLARFFPFLDGVHMHMRRTPRTKRDHAWEALAARHRGHPFLRLDPLYALVEEVIDAINEKIPAFFTPDQEQFERSLARMRGNGFFRQCVIGGELPAATSMDDLAARPVGTIGDLLNEFARIPGSPEEAAKVLAGRLAPVLSSDWLPDQQRDTLTANLEELIAIFREASGYQAGAVTRALVEQRDEEALLRQRQEAYAGWLIMEPRFLQELETLRQAHHKKVAQLGAFPRRSDRPSTQRLPTCARECVAFYQRWGLECLLTWELPLPLPMRFELVPDGQTFAAEEAALLAIPWYVLRGGRIDLRQLARRLRHTSAPSHLRDWVLKEPGNDEDVAGDRAYQRLFWLYRCHELILLRRYPAACARHVESLDRALAAVMGRGEDLVKRLRQRLARARRSWRKQGDTH